MDLTKLRERRATIATECNAIIERSAKEARAVTPEEKERFDSLEKESNELKGTIERSDRLADTQRELNTFSSAVKPVIELNAKEKAQYSILRAIRNRMEGKPLEGLELEVHQEIERSSGKKARGFYMPTNLPTISRTTGLFDNANTGSGLRKTTVTDQFIDVLRNATLLNKVGATFMDGLVGQVSIPKKTAATTAYWVGEGGVPTTSNPTMTAQVTFSNKTVGAFTDITRYLAAQTSVSAEMIVRNDIAETLGTAIDSAAFNGTGSSNQPTGLFNISGITTTALGTNGAALTWANIVGMETSVLANNVTGSMAYVSNNKVKGALKVAPKVSGYPVFIWDEDDTVNGYPAYVSNSIPSNLTKGSASGICSGAIFGNFSDLVVGTWGAVDIMIDPYTLSSSGGVRVVQLQDVDIQVRRTESFVRIVDILA
jgi:HK97 family phage major capsid protein